MVNQPRQSRWVESATTGSTRLHRFVAPPTAEPLGWINKSEVAESIQPAPVLQVKKRPYKSTFTRWITRVCVEV